MFTGLVRAVGEVVRREGRALEVRAQIARPAVGASVAINGCCLTVTAAKGGVLSFDVGPETWARTNLAAAKSVNVEPSLRVGDELGGHFVLGHVDAAARVLALEPWKNGFRRLRVALPAALRPLVAEKGSIAVDGVSLTVTKAARGWFEVMLVPHTLENTNLGSRRAGEPVNLEADPLARYALRSRIR